MVDADGGDERITLKNSAISRSCAPSNYPTIIIRCWSPPSGLGARLHIHQRCSRRLRGGRSGHWFRESTELLGRRRLRPGHQPSAVAEQQRGSVVHGLGDALYEHCLYDQAGQLQNATMADYLVPMSGESPDIVIEHVTTPTSKTTLGAKGAGESGMAGVPQSILSAVNDAIQPFGGSIRRAGNTRRRVACHGPD